MATLEEYFEQATAPGPNRQLPGCVMIAANKDGKCGVVGESKSRDIFIPGAIARPICVYHESQPVRNRIDADHVKASHTPSALAHSRWTPSRL